MKVCIDIQSALGQRAGIGRYTSSLVGKLADWRENDSVRLFGFDFRRRGSPFPDCPGMEQKTLKWCPGRIMQKSWNLLRWPPFDALAGRADVYHFPNFIVPPLSSGGCVATVHDVSFMAYPQFTEKRNLAWLTRHIKNTVTRADAIITDSAFSAEEIIQRLSVERERVFPIHLGISEHFKPPVPDDVEKMREKSELNRPYILMVGTIEPRKNIEFLISVFERMKDFEGCLVLAGMRGWKYHSIMQRMNDSPRSGDIRFMEYVPDTALPALYGGADLFVFPSFYEGFGFPPLEAMACGTPVIASDAGSLPEVLGEAALVISGFDPDVWADRAMRTLSDIPLRVTMAEKGRAQASRYTWRETARKTWEVYRSVA